MSEPLFDTALRDEPTIAPSPAFAHRVMRSVRREAARRGAISFPWPLLTTSLGVTAALTLAGVLTGGGPAEAETAARIASQAPVAAWLSTTLAGSLGLVWWSVRLAGRA